MFSVDVESNTRNGLNCQILLMVIKKTLQSEFCRWFVIEDNVGDVVSFLRWNIVLHSLNPSVGPYR